MDFKKFGNFNWIEMDSKDQNLDLTRTKRIYFCLFQSIFVCWAAGDSRPLTITFRRARPGGLIVEWLSFKRRVGLEGRYRIQIVIGRYHE